MANYDATAAGAQVCTYDQELASWEAPPGAASIELLLPGPMLDAFPPQLWLIQSVVVLLLIYAGRLFYRIATGDLVPLRAYLELRSDRDYWRNRAQGDGGS